MGLPALNVCIVFHTLWEDAMLQIDSMGVPTLNVCIAFYTLWEDALLPKSLHPLQFQARVFLLTPHMALSYPYQSQIENVHPPAMHLLHFRPRR